MPLLFDMPLEKLYEYQGRNPRPADFDLFWDRSLAEMHAVDPQVELVPATFKVPFADCFHLYFTGTGDARVHAKLLRPKQASEPHPASVILCNSFLPLIKKGINTRKPSACSKNTTSPAGK